MNRILAFAGSNSSTSINHELLRGVTATIRNGETSLIRLTDFPLPMFGEDIERKEGYPDTLQDLLSIIKEADGLIISVNEHNGTVSAYFKNVLDWLSRIEYKFLQDKKVMLLSTSNGKRGARGALQYTASVLPRFDAEVIDSVPVASYKEVYDADSLAFRDVDVEQRIRKGVEKLIQSLS